MHHWGKSQGHQKPRSHAPEVTSPIQDGGHVKEVIEAEREIQSPSIRTVEENKITGKV